LPLEFEIAFALIEFFGGAPGHIQEHLLSREVGPPLAATTGGRRDDLLGDCFVVVAVAALVVADLVALRRRLLVVAIIVVIVGIVFVVVPSQLDGQTIDTVRMVPENQRVGSDVRRGSESDVAVSSVGGC